MLMSLGGPQAKPLIGSMETNCDHPFHHLKWKGEDYKATYMECGLCEDYLSLDKPGRILEKHELPSEQEVMNWVDEASRDGMGRHLVPLSQLTAHFGWLRGPFFDMIIQMERDDKIDLQCHNTWAQRHHSGEFVEGRDFIHPHKGRQGMGFINTRS